MENNNGDGHAVTLEKVVTKPDGSREMVLADPGHGRIRMSESEFNERYRGYAITTNQ